MIKWRQLTSAVQTPTRGIAPSWCHRGYYEIEVRTEGGKKLNNGAHAFDFADRSRMHPDSKFTAADFVRLGRGAAQPFAPALGIGAGGSQCDRQRGIPKQTIKA
jgi:hypothetical protein